MANLVVVGTQWGDESKGKIVDYLTPRVEMVVRYGGGNNAGHSVMVGSELYKLHLVPSGILHSQVTCVLSDGVVIDPGTALRLRHHLRMTSLVAQASLPHQTRFIVSP